MEPGVIFIMVNDRYVRIELPQIMYVEACGTNARVVTVDRELECMVNIDRIARVLVGPDFCRVHPSYIISTNKIVDFDECAVNLPGKTIPVDRRFQKQFYANCLFFFELLGKTAPASLFIDLDGELHSR